MKRLVLASFFLCFYAHAVEQASLQEQQERMQYLVQNDPDLQKKFVECETKNKGSKSLATDVSKCIWEGLDPKTKAQLAEAITKKDINSDDDDASLKYTSDNRIKEKVTKKNSGTKAYEEYLKKQLNEVLYGDVAKTISDSGNNKAFGGKEELEVVQKAIDHKDFHALYESQLGKNIIQEVSAYCIEAGSDGSIPGSEQKRKDNRRENMKLLGMFDGQNQNEAAIIASKCMNKIPDSCRNKGEKNACLVMDYIEKAKQTIILTSKIQETWNKRSPGSDNKEVTINSNEFVNITSAQVEESGYAEATLKEGQLLEQCKTNYNAYKAQCNEYLSSQDDSLKAVVDSQLKKEILISQLEKIKNEDDQKGLKDFLEEQGYAETKIQQILSGDWKKKLEDEVLPLYKKEKDALAQSVQEQLAKYEGLSDAELQDPKKVEDKFLEIQEAVTGQKNFDPSQSLSLDSKPEVFKQVVHFSNIISAFISKDKVSGKQNTQALLREISDGNSAFGISRGTASQGQPATQQIQLNQDHLQNIRKHITPGGDEDGTVQIDQNTINDIFGPIQTN